MFTAEQKQSQEPDNSVSSNPNPLFSPKLIYWPVKNSLFVRGEQGLSPIELSLLEQICIPTKENPVRKNQAAIIAGFCVLFLIGMVALDLHLAFSNTNADHQTSKYTLGFKAGEAAPQVKNLSFRVDGSGVFPDRLRKELAVDLSNNPAFMGNAQSIKERTIDIENPILVVEIQSKRLLWTPIYSQAELSINFGYSSTGDIRWKYDDKDVVEMQESPSVFVEGDVIIQDKSFGFMTWRGYQNLLAGIAARHINTTLAQQLTANPAWEPLKH